MSEENEVAERPDLDQLTSIYLKIRDKRAENKREFENVDKDLEEQQKMLAEQMLDTCKEMNADSIRTPHGTIIRSVKSKYWTGDWDSMYNFIKEHDAFGLLEKRLHQTNMKDFLNENPDVMPMGLNVENEYTIVVRRAKN
jgi:sugar phosphate isomerase/epimerase